MALCHHLIASVEQTYVQNIFNKQIEGLADVFCSATTSRYNQFIEAYFLLIRTNFRIFISSVYPHTPTSTFY